MWKWYLIGPVLEWWIFVFSRESAFPVLERGFLSSWEEPPPRFPYGESLSSTFTGSIPGMSGCAVPSPLLPPAAPVLLLLCCLCCCSAIASVCPVADEDLLDETCGLPTCLHAEFAVWVVLCSLQTPPCLVPRWGIFVPRENPPAQFLNRGFLSCTVLEIEGFSK